MAEDRLSVSPIPNQAKVLIERWRVHYNTVKPHSSPGYRPPAPEAVAPIDLARAQRKPDQSGTKYKRIHTRADIDSGTKIGEDQGNKIWSGIVPDRLLKSSNT